MFVEGCPRETLPEPNRRLVVGLDGGYVHAREGENRKAGWFEVIVGKRVPAEGAAKCFGLVNSYDEKPKRRVFELLRGQGLQMNQAITFLSGGGDTVRDLQLYLSPQAEHVLDWFHMTMRLTVICPMTKGLSSHKPRAEMETDLERLKWCLWHGNVFRALQVVDEIQFDLETIEDGGWYPALPNAETPLRLAA
jgi:hypothetical protein